MISFTFFHWDVTLRYSPRSINSWRVFKTYKDEFSYHVVFGKLSLLVENWTLEIHALCKECGSPDIGEVSFGDEGLTVCQSCQSVEQGYKYVNLREYENA